MRTISPIGRWLARIAWRMSSSETSRPLPSSIVMALSVPETTSSSEHFCSSSCVGLMTNSSWTLATRTEPVGPRNGMAGEIVSAAEAPIMLRMSGSFCWSAESTTPVSITSSK